MGHVKILVTGGTGYIGAHVIALLRARGDEAVIVDDLVSGIPARVPGTPITEMDLADVAAVEPLRGLITREGIDAVIHFAGRKQVGESVEKPAWYYRENVGGLANLLLALEGTDVRRVLFSSSAAVYGATEGEAIDEDAPTAPINPYGDTKLIGERMLAAAAEPLGLASTSLRYFNVAGAGRPELGDTAVLNLVPMVFERLDRGEGPAIFGDDYPTPDGSCIRDYIHVQDLAEAHVAALDALDAARPGHTVYNVGTGRGTSVREMVEAILAVSGSTLEPEVLPRRAGDPAWVVASPARIERELGWTARFGITEIIASAWEAHRSRDDARSTP